MNSVRLIFLALLASVYGCLAVAQDIKAANPAAVPPNLLKFVHRDLPAGREPEFQKIQSTLARKCDALNFPNFWIQLRSLTGAAESLRLDLLDSFEHLEASQADWKHLNSAHAELAKIEEDINGLAGSGRTVLAFRRDDLSHLLDAIDLSEARFFRLSEVRLFPGHESDFAEATKLLTEAHSKSDADFPWVVYQLAMGGSTPTFLILSPMSDLKQNDDLLALRLSMMEAAEGDQAHDRLMQIARESFASVEAHLFVVEPETSHVSSEFAAGDPAFWRPPVEAHEPGIGTKALQARPSKKETKPAQIPTSQPN